MAERSPDKLPSDPMSAGAAPAQAADVFTLHHAVLSRWDAGRSLGAAHASAGVALTHGHDRWLGGLAGLSTLGGSFGPSAWNMAAQLVAEPTLLTRLGADLRSLQVGELADLVQLILEEEEGQVEVAELEAAIEAETSRARGGVATTKAGSARAAATKAAPARGAAPRKLAGTSAAKAAGRRAPLHLQNKLKELRRVLAEVRRADASGVLPPQQAGDVGTDSPSQSIARRNEQGGTAQPSPASVATGRGGPLNDGVALQSPLQRVAAAGRQASMARAGWASPFSSVAQAQTAAAAPRALRMAEQAADLALLDLAMSEAGSGFGAGFGADVPAGDREGASPQVRGQRAATAVPALATTTQVGAFAALRQQWSAQQAQAQLSLGSLAQARALAPSAATASQTGQRQGTAAARQTQQTQSALEPQSRGQDAAAVLAQAGQSGPAVAELPADLSAQPTRRAAVAQAALRAVAPPAQRAFAGMAAAVGHARAHLQRLDAGLAKMAQHQGAPALAGAEKGAARGALQEGGQRQAVGQSGGVGDLGLGQERASASLQRWQTWSDRALDAFAGAGSARVYRGALAAGGEDREVLGLAQELATGGDAAQAMASADGVTVAAGRRGAVAERTAAAGLAPIAGPAASQSPTAAQVSAASARPAAGSAPPAPGRLSAYGGAARSTSAPSALQLPAWIAPQASAAALPSAAASTGRAVLAQGQSVPDQLAHQWAKATAGVPGLSAATVAGFAERFVGRSSLGLDPSLAGGAAAATAQWGLGAPTDAANARRMFPTGQGSLGQGSLGQDSLGQGFVGLGSFDPQTAGFAAARVGSASAGQLGYGDAARQAPGEWLAPGSDAQDADGATEAARAELQGAVPRAATAVSRSQPLRAFAQASAAKAAVAAVERAQRQAVAALRAVAASGQRGSSVLQSVTGLAELGVLAAAPGGQADALTPWLAKRLTAGTTVSKAAASDGAGELLSLGDEANPASAQGLATGDGPGPTAARSAQAATGRRQGRAETSPVASSAAPHGSRSASASVESLTPQALRTILQALGEPTAAAERDVASAFAAKWLGRADVAGKVLRRMASDATPAGELLTMRDSSVAPGEAAAPARSTAGQGIARSTAGQGIARSAGGQDIARSAGGQGIGKGSTSKQTLAAGPAGPVAAQVDGDQVVLSGFAALAALASGDFGQRPAPRQMTGTDVERTMLTPAADDAAQVQPEVAPSAAAPVRAAPKADSRKLAAVKLHEFAPMGLKRGRNLLGQQRRSSWLHTTPRGEAATSRSLRRLAGSRVGYGAAALGAGDLLGLVQGDAEMFFGDGAPSPSAVRGADRLSQAVMTRRGHTHRPTPSAAPVGAFEGEQVMPSDFRAGGDASAALQASMAASGRSGGATAGIKATQAAAMTRVLSVTSAPSANVLPLVAPAAQAVVAAAAAKPLSESIVTSGADPTVGMPISGVGGHKAGKAGGGAEKERAAAEEHGSNVQDLEALAMKVARSVMVRIKRERERRGLHV